MKYQKGFSVLATVLLVIAVIIVGIGTYVWYRTTSTLNSLEQQRQEGRNKNIQSNLVGFMGLAKIYFDSQNPRSYGIAVTGTAGCTTPGSMFTSNRFRGDSNYSPLLNPDIYPSDTQLVCNVSADGQAYAVQANLIGGDYWCVDSTRQSKAESVPLGTQTKCQ